MPLFDSYLLVDWSAAAYPKFGSNSIWLCLIRRGEGNSRHVKLENPETRAKATERIIELATDNLQKKQRLLIGFDFPFGYPTGTVDRLGFQGLPWRSMWQFLEDQIEDQNDNQNNRFDVAEYLNFRLSGEAFPFWGLVREEFRTNLLRRGRRPHGLNDLPEWRSCDLIIPRLQPVWKLAGVGSVGSQSLTGIPRVWQIRKAPAIAFHCHIWPFETGLQFDPRPSIILAEVYPSLTPTQTIAGKPKDAGQVATFGRWLMNLDDNNQLKELFFGDPRLTAENRRRVELEEAWILGVK